MVTDITRRLEFDRLARAAGAQRQEVLRDPMPHLARMGVLVSKLRLAIEEADHCLSGAGEPLEERIARAREVLGTALEEA